MIGRPVKIAVISVGVLFLIMLVVPDVLILLVTLFLGWWPSAGRMIQGWHASAGSVTLFVLATLMFLAGSHWFASWLFASLALTSNKPLPAPMWRWRWTMRGLAIVFCALMAIASLVLTTHQIYWMSRSTDPVLVSLRSRLSIISVAGDLQRMADDQEWDSDKTRAAFWQMNLGPAGELAGELLQPVWVGGETNRLRAIVLIPRRPLHRSSARLMVLQPGASVVFHSLDELPQVLASLHVLKSRGGLASRGLPEP